jgi:hypothetical protein
MRNLLIVIGVLLLVTNIKAQTLFPITDPTNKWVIEERAMLGTDHTYWSWNDTDTLINNNTYKILKVKDYPAKYYIRTNPVNKKVMLWNGNTEYMLYDFSLQEGAWVDLYIDYVKYSPSFRVIKRDTIYTKSGIPQIRILLREYSPGPMMPAYELEWVEGIGSNTHIVYPYANNYPKKTSDNIFYILSCFKNNCTVPDTLFDNSCFDTIAIKRSHDTLFTKTKVNWYDDTTLIKSNSHFLLLPNGGNYTAKVIDSFGCIYSSSAYINTGLNDAITNNHLIEIYPNPVTDVFYIKSQEKIKYIMIFNSLGVEVGYITSSNPNILNIYNLSYLSEGIYFLKIEGEGWECNKKIIKSNID